MDRHQCETLVYYTFASFRNEPQFFHAVLTRHGGYSDRPWNSLNLGGSVGDDPLRVRQNKLHALRTLGRQPGSAVDTWQVHGTEVLFASQPRLETDRQHKADILLTDSNALTLLMRFADCVPVLLYDPIQRVAGMVHSGWQGTVKKAAQFAVEAMRTRYQSKPENIIAGIGPSICLNHYQVGPNVIEHVQHAFGPSANNFLVSLDGSVHFDLWKSNEYILRQSGVERIECSNLCTACNTDDFYSHRQEKGRTGRFGVIVGLSA